MTTGLKPPFPVPDDRILRRVPSDSTWTDEVWRFEGAAPGTQQSQCRLSWKFGMPDGSTFDQPAWTGWREAARTFVWSLFADPPVQRGPIKFGTVRLHYKRLRVLVIWMIKHGFRALTDLDRGAQQRFLSDLAQRKRRGKAGGQIKSSTIWLYHHTLQELFLQGLQYPELAIAEPSPRHMETRAIKPIPYTPDEIAVPLIQGALRLMGEPASDVIDLQARAQAAYQARLDAGVKTHAVAAEAMIPAIAGFTFATLPGEDGPWYQKPITSTVHIRNLLDRITDAAFLLLSYLVGMRVSEILGLEAGCVVRQRSIDQKDEFLFVEGRIYKTASSEQGSPHRWIAPDIVERAIYVMEQLSTNLRARSGKANLWLAPRCSGMPGAKAQIVVLSIQAVTHRLNAKLAPFVDLPTYRGQPWHLSTHQGRKTFARFVARQDRTGLQALKEHFGHRSIVMTDQAYAGVGHDLFELMDEEVREEVARSFAESLTAEKLGGAAGAEISARSPFRGQAVEDGALEYARARLRDTNLAFEICDYGFCYYNRSYSACHGDDRGPNPVFRTQSTCVRCKNFIVAPKHRLVWEDRLIRYRDFLEGGEVGLGIQEDIEQKIAECDQVLTQLDAPHRPQ